MQKSIDTLNENRKDGNIILFWNYRWSYLDPLMRHDQHVGTLADLIESLTSYEETDTLADSEIEDLKLFYADVLASSLEGIQPKHFGITLEYAPHGEDDPTQGCSVVEVHFSERLNGLDLRRR